MSTINLLPDDYIQRRARRHANILCIVLFTVVMGGVAAAALVSEQSMRHTQHVRDQVNADYAKATEMLKQMQRLEAQKRTRMRKAQATAELLERVPRSFVLASLARALPPQTSLLKVDLRPRPRNSGGKDDEDQPPVTVLDVTGLAATDVEVARFIANLLRDPLMASVELSYSQETKVEDRSAKDDKALNVRQFRITLELRDGIDVIDLMDEQGLESVAEAKESDPTDEEVSS